MSFYMPQQLLQLSFRIFGLKSNPYLEMSLFDQFPSKCQNCGPNCDFPGTVDNLHIQLVFCSCPGGAFHDKKRHNLLLSPIILLLHLGAPWLHSILARDDICILLSPIPLLQQLSKPMTVPHFQVINLTNKLSNFEKISPASWGNYDETNIF